MRLAIESKLRSRARRLIVPVSEFSFAACPVAPLSNFDRRASSARRAVTNGGQESWRTSGSVRRIRERMDTCFQPLELDSLPPGEHAVSWPVAVIEGSNRLAPEIHDTFVQDFAGIPPHFEPCKRRNESTPLSYVKHERQIGVETRIRGTASGCFQGLLNYLGQRRISSRQSSDIRTVRHPVLAKNGAKVDLCNLHHCSGL
jgi:hypothetical protein